jgi:tubulin---tyrosine ligase
MLSTSQNGISKSYFFEESYIRTSSVLFTLKNLQNKMIHLTNDAVQKRSDDYGKFEGGNKIS